MDKIIVYGLTEKEWKKHLKEGDPGTYLGEFNGAEFKQEENIVEGAKRFQYLHLHDKWGCRLHTPQRFNKNIIEKIKRQHINSYGNNSQISMFQ